MIRLLADETATAALAKEVLLALPAKFAGWTLLLRGDLGAGKSTFARAFIRAAGQSGAIPSPTYTLIEPYDLPRGRLYHVDLYRIADTDELRYLGWHELDDGCRLVEWPERAPDLRERADLEIGLSYAGDGREARLAGLSDRGRYLVSALPRPDSKD